MNVNNLYARDKLSITFDIRDRLIHSQINKAFELTVTLTLL